MEIPKIHEGEYRFCLIMWEHEPVCILRHTAAVGAVVQRPLCGLSSGRN